MSERRLERQRLQRRSLLERAMDQVAADGFEVLDPDAAAREAGLTLRSLGRLHRKEDIFFPEHGETLMLLGEMLEGAGLLETCLALARFQEEDRDHWLRRLAFIDAQPRLRAYRVLLDRDYRALFSDHFRRWGAGGPAGERQAAFEAACVLAAFREAERQWVEGNGRPLLPVLVHEALAVLWPALYAHARRHAR
jgi:hypothetical protein